MYESRYILSKRKSHIGILYNRSSSKMIFAQIIANCVKKSRLTSIPWIYLIKFTRKISFFDSKQFNRSESLVKFWTEKIACRLCKTRITSSFTINLVTGISNFHKLIHFFPEHINSRNRLEESRSGICREVPLWNVAFFNHEQVSDNEKQFVVLFLGAKSDLGFRARLRQRYIPNAIGFTNFTQARCWPIQKGISPKMKKKILTHEKNPAVSDTFSDSEIGQILSIAKFEENFQTISTWKWGFFYLSEWLSELDFIMLRIWTNLKKNFSRKKIRLGDFMSEINL